MQRSKEQDKHFRGWGESSRQIFNVRRRAGYVPCCADTDENTTVEKFKLQRERRHAFWYSFCLIPALLHQWDQNQQISRNIFPYKTYFYANENSTVAFSNMRETLIGNLPIIDVAVVIERDRSLWVCVWLSSAAFCKPASLSLCQPALLLFPMICGRGADNRAYKLAAKNFDRR